MSIRPGSARPSSLSRKQSSSFKISDAAESFPAKTDVGPEKPRTGPKKLAKKKVVFTKPKEPKEPKESKNPKEPKPEKEPSQNQRKNFVKINMNRNF
jgi:hypothetical protein